MAGGRQAECRDLPFSCLFLLGAIGCADRFRVKGRSDVPDQLAEALLRYMERHPGESPFMTVIDSMAIMRTDHPKPPSHMTTRTIARIRNMVIPLSFFKGFARGAISYSL